MNITDLNYEELLLIEGGNCPKCREQGRQFGRIIKENIVWETISEGASSLWDTVSGWFK